MTKSRKDREKGRRKKFQKRFNKQARRIRSQRIYDSGEERHSGRYDL
jgi:hypothetical protein